MDQREREDGAAFQQRLLDSIETLHKQIAGGVTCVERWHCFLELALQLTSSARGLVALRSRLAPPHAGACVAAVQGFSTSESVLCGLASHWIEALETTEHPQILNAQSPPTLGATSVPDCQNALMWPLWVGGHLQGVVVLCDKSGGYLAADSRAPQPFISMGACLVGLQDLETRCLDAEHSREELNERFHNIVHSSEELIWMGLPGALEPLYLNPAFERIWGRRFDEMRGSPERLLETFHPEDRESFLETLRQQGQGQTTSLHYRIIRPDGSIRWIWDRAFPVVDAQGKVVSVNGLAADVTERFEAEQTLKRSEERLRVIYEQMPDSVFLIDIDDPAIPAKILYANGEACRSHGVDPDSMVGRSITEFETEADASRVSERIQMLRNGETARFEAEHLRKDGTLFPVEVVARLLPALGKGVVLAIDRDITMQSQAEKARLQLEARLRQGQKMEAIGRLAGGIAHDFNNILGVILGNVELARQDVAAPHPALESLDEILNASRRGKSLVRQILAFSRQQAPDRKAIELPALVEEAKRMLRATLPAGITFKTVFDPAEPSILADPIQVHQVLMNLCSNAAQAMNSHGTITVSTKRIQIPEGGEITLPQLAPGDYVRVSISDTGPGIPSSLIGQIFEPFFTTKPEGQGTGLGLSVVHGIMESHQGAVRVSSEMGHGAKFELFFPAATVGDSQTSSVNRTRPRQTILILDDDLPVLTATQKVLERQGYRVEAFSQPNDALTAMRNHRNSIALIVTDYRMPNMDGMSFVAEAMRLRPGTPIVLTSGYISDELRKVASNLGVRSILPKPSTSEELCESVREALLGLTE